MFQLPWQFSPDVVEIERFRACHRRHRRNQQLNVAPSSNVEDLDVDEGRTRKTPAKWRERRQQQHQQLPVNHQEDGIWPESAGTEMHLGFNAFDFAASPECFVDEVEQPEESKALPSHEITDLQLESFYHEGSELSDENNMLTDETDEGKALFTKRQLNMAHVAKQVTSMGFNSASLWERKFPSLPQPGGLARTLPSLGQNGRREAPVHYTTHAEQRRALYYRYYA
ncbi:uncharacterized protein KRP23_3240 [Phytophthora ramorum]|uniref:uncharacterized protein n=1 Tax=Phytophthora ramorum TaxID=164328 RepID=UPI0030A4FB74|nr:hypothetical protein KRP23_3240 [Phytophthora ramorum]